MQVPASASVRRRDRCGTKRNGPRDRSVGGAIFAYEVKVCFADTRCNTDDQFVFHTILNALEGLVENVFSTPALIADQVGSFDADQRGGIADLSQPSCDFLRNQLPVGENLEVTVAVGF